MYKIFLSYGHSDKERASDVYRQLTELGQTVWMGEAPTDSNGPVAFLGIPAGHEFHDLANRPFFAMPWGDPISGMLL